MSYHWSHYHHKGLSPGQTSRALLLDHKLAQPFWWPWGPIYQHLNIHIPFEPKIPFCSSTGQCVLPDTISPFLCVVSSVPLERELQHHFQHEAQWQADGVTNKCPLTLVGPFISETKWEPDQKKESWTLILTQSHPVTLRRPLHDSKPHGFQPSMSRPWWFLKVATGHHFQDFEVSERFS